MEKKKVPPRYDAAFKEGAVKLVTEAGRQPKEVADDAIGFELCSKLGISVTSLRDWLKLSGVSPKEAGRSNKDAKRIRELEAANRELKKQVTEKDEVIAVLKKSSLVCFANRIFDAPAFRQLFVFGRCVVG